MIGKTNTLLTALAMAIAVTSMSIAQELTSLRGNTPIEQTNGAPEIARQNTQGRFERNYRQQPPLIPHTIAGYEIDLKVNQCLSCHDWTVSAAHNAPKVSETHYVTREGVQLDTVAGTRWFCNQCHVPQANAVPLVANDFVPSHDLR